MQDDNSIVSKSVKGFVKIFNQLFLSYNVVFDRYGESIVVNKPSLELDSVVIILSKLFAIWVKGKLLRLR